MSSTEVPEIVQLVLNMELLAISSVTEVGSEHTVCFGAFLELTKVFEHQKNHLLRRGVGPGLHLEDNVSSYKFLLD